MADFCWQCTKTVLGWNGEKNDFYDASEKDHPLGPYRTVLCEGCGPIQVDWEGKCISTDCMENGHVDPQAAHS